MFGNLFSHPGLTQNPSVGPIEHPGFIDGRVTFFSNLPDAAANAGKIFIVDQGEGLYLVNRKSGGLYRSDGSAWFRLGNIVAFFSDLNMKVYNNTDTTKRFRFDVSSVGPGQERVLMIQNSDGTVAYLTDIKDKASQIINDSSVPGAFVKQALDDLDFRVKANESGYARRKRVINIVNNTLAPPTENEGDRYILDNTGASHAGWDGAAGNDIVTFTSGVWVAETPIEGWVAYVDNENKDALFVDDGTPQWELRPTIITDHGDLSGLGDDDHTQYHTDARADTWLSGKFGTSAGQVMQGNDQRAIRFGVQGLFKSADTEVLPVVIEKAVQVTTIGIRPTDVNNGSPAALAIEATLTVFRNGASIGTVITNGSDYVTASLTVTNFAAGDILAVRSDLAPGVNRQLAFNVFGTNI